MKRMMGRLGGLGLSMLFHISMQSARTCWHILRAAAILKGVEQDAKKGLALRQTYQIWRTLDTAPMVVDKEGRFNGPVFREAYTLQRNSDEFLRTTHLIHL